MFQSSRCLQERFRSDKTVLVVESFFLQVRLRQPMAWTSRAEFVYLPGIIASHFFATVPKNT